MANTFNYDNLTCESLSNYLHEAGWETLPTIVQDAINSRKGLKIPANGSDVYFLWNTAQDTFVYVDMDPSISNVLVSKPVELYNRLYNFYANLSNKEIQNLKDQKEELNGWDKFVGFFSFLGLSTERMRRNNRIDKAINAKINASVRETMKKAGITNKDVLPPAADEKDKMLEGLSWDELDEYVKKGNVSTQQKEAKTEVKVDPKNTVEKKDPVQVRQKTELELRMERMDQAKKNIEKLYEGKAKDYSYSYSLFAALLDSSIDMSEEPDLRDKVADYILALVADQDKHSLDRMMKDLNAPDFFDDYNLSSQIIHADQPYSAFHNGYEAYMRQKQENDMYEPQMQQEVYMNEPQMQQENDTYEPQMQQEVYTYEPQMQQENDTNEPQIPYYNTDEPDLDKSMDSIQRGNSIDEKKPEITEPPVPEIPVPEKYAKYSAPVQKFVKNILNNKYIKKDGCELTPEQLDDLVSIVDEMRKSDVTVVKNMGMWLTSLEDERTLEAVVITHTMDKKVSPLKVWCEKTELQMQNNPKTDQNELVESFKKKIDENKLLDLIKS